MEPLILQFIEQHKDELIEKWTDEMNFVRGQQRLQHITDEMYTASNRKFIHMLIDSMVLDITERNDRVKLFAIEQMQLGWPLQYLTKGLQSFKKGLINSIQATKQSELDKIDLYNGIHLYNSIQEWIDSIIDQLIAEYTGNWEATSTLQKLALKELSAPLIPVFEGICVMPLIGTIDTERARLIMENLLNGVIKYESEVVLIDITGVPVVDTMVAHHLIQASEAVRLVGAKTVLVGIRPEIAQTIVNLGIQLGDFKTTSSLRKGMELAFTITGNKMTKNSVEIDEEGA
jgi:rsbT co-antagonist protein RsbR